MAKAVINLQKESGGIVKISPVDGAGITELVVPESGELVTKDYADLKVALAAFTGANQSLASSGYQKFPGGLIIQWATVYINNGAGTWIFPIAFPNVGFQVFVSQDEQQPVMPAGARIISNTSALLSSETTLDDGFFAFAIGY